MGQNDVMKSWQLALATTVSTFCTSYFALAGSDVQLSLRAVSALAAAAVNAGIGAAFLATRNRKESK